MVFVSRRTLCHDSPIGLAYFIFDPEHLVKARKSLTCACKNHKTHCGAVQTVNHSEKNGSGLCIAVFDIRLNVFAKRAVARNVALNYFAGFLAHYYYMVVLVNNLHDVLLINRVAMVFPLATL